MRIVFALFIVLGVSTAFAADKSESKDKSQWRNTMNQLSKALADVVPYLYPDPSLDQRKLTEKVRKIYELTKNIDIRTTHGVTLPDEDPALPYIASMFHQEVERAYQSLQDGHVEYGKAVLRSSVSYCITCHTRNQLGTQFPVLQAFEKPLQKASWIERTEFETASRQYDKVLSDVMGQLKSPGAPGISAMDLERGARMALSILVRIKKDPDRAALLAKSMGESPNATLSMKEASKTWLKDIRDWQSGRDRKFKGTEEKLAEARKLIGTDPKPVDNGEVRFLRASSLLHEVLQADAKPEETAEALYLIGMAYSALGEIGMWNLHEMYYVACIEKAPHSVLAEKCFRAYNDSMTLGYSGSSGVHIPKPVREHLQRLKDKAKVK